MPSFDLKAALEISFGRVAILAYSKLETSRTVEASKNYSRVSGTIPVRDYTNEGENLVGVPMFLPCTLDGWTLPSEPIIDISGGKTLEKTQIDGQDGTFKELFSKNDYIITIRGILCQEDGTSNYPKDLVRRMREICENVKNIPISCSLTSLFGVNKIVIETFSFPAVEGFQDMQPFQLNCLSDKDIILDLNKA